MGGSLTKNTNYIKPWWAPSRISAPRRGREDASGIATFDMVAGTGDAVYRETRPDNTVVHHLLIKPKEEVN